MCSPPLLHARRSSAHRSRRQRAERRGAIIVLTAVLLILVLVLCALSFDTGYMYLAQTELQRAVDAGALAGAGAMQEGSDGIEPAVLDLIERNSLTSGAIDADDIEITTGEWDPQTRQFVPKEFQPSALRVLARIENRALFFGPVYGDKTFQAQAQSIVMFQPRDIMVVLDYSASMNDDSELRNIGSLGQASIEANLFQIYQELGSPQFGNMQWEPQYISSNYTSTIKYYLGLNNEPYPYPSGSWDDYIYYVRSSNYISRAGYYKRYGYLTFMNYLLEKRPMHSQTPDLWKTSEQPITAVKDAVSVLLAYVQEEKSDDRIGLAVYTSSNDQALLEQGLTRDMQDVEDISRERQAGHYDTMTNIGAGLQVARHELEENARVGAFKMIVLITDGIANLPSYGANSFLLEEAQLCADNHFPVVAVSLGANADANIMQQVADITGGVHFNIPGGGSVAAYEEPLKDVFRQVAASRPLRIVE
jgi:hypothetical protein